ncbi:restriction endonuclease subunit S [Exiguobacterium sp. ERU656]|uniref:restriction endonuclease subunit S n=1 Tax=Exiguobacterium sp. ERU656 TaxID=2751217 RepID=UPI001BEA20BB|nr:restriction endonuclease subunit S [Exiguobacterium sp. ERU656]
MEFKKYSLSDIADVQTGPFGSQLHKEDYVDTGTPIITVEHLGENKIIHSNLPKVNRKDWERLSKYTLKKNDIVFSRVGSVDRCALVSDNEENWLFSGRCLRVRVKNLDIVDPKYLSYYFANKKFKRYIRSIAVGATMPSINTKILSELQVEIPDINSQRKVAELFHSLDSKKWTNESIIKNLEQVSKSIFKHWFVDFEFPNAEGEPYKSSGGKMVNSELGNVPAEWNTYNVGDFVESISQSINKKEKKLAKFLNTSDILAGEIKEVNFLPTNDMPGQAKKMIKNNDILFSEIRPKNRRYAYVDIESPQDYVVSTKLMVLRINEELFSSKLFYIWLTLPSTINELNHIAESRSGTFPQITFSIISKLKLALPPKKHFTELEASFIAMFNKINELRLENKALSKLRDTLLPKLLSGELEIPEKLEV